jgi:hypothetical protein
MEEDIAVNVGRQASLEGGWAGMKGRIDDVRKGEKGIEEEMWLTWIPAQQQSTQVQSRDSASKKHNNNACPFELVAITSSGSHYRIGVANPEVRAPSSDKSTILDMYKEDSCSHAEHGAEDSESNNVKEGPQCWLIEYQRFGMRDDWAD